MGRRGQFIIVALSGDLGKPRPALVIQNDIFAALNSVLICPLTSALRFDSDEFRIEVLPTPLNGLRRTSYVAIDKTTVVGRKRIGSVIGEADDPLLARVGSALAIFAGLA